MILRRFLLLSLASSAAATGARAQAARLDASADLGLRRAVERELVAARAIGLPEGLLVAKANEGIAKRATPKRITDAVAALGKRLQVARDQLAPNPSDDEIAAGADALYVGVPAPMLKKMRAAWPNRSLALPLGVLTELVAKGLPPGRAAQVVTDLMARGATNVQLYALAQSVQGDVAAGWAPEAALDLRARGVMSLLPPAPAASAFANPLSRRP
ncbi:MAG TPA: hypothetical protein VGJ96_15165 [Gemmatimonadaceae bacterium]|jgi:hypothetical protein